MKELTAAEKDSERVSYANQNFDALKKVYPKRHNVQDDLDLLSDGTDENAKESARKRMDKAFNSIDQKNDRRRKRQSKKPSRIGIHNTGPDLRSFGHHGKKTLSHGLNLFTTGKIQEGLKSIGHAFVTAAYGFSAISRSLGISPVLGLLAATSFTTGVLLYGHHQDQKAKTLVDDFKTATQDKDANMQLFAQTAIEGSKSGISPIILTMVMAAETGFYDVDGMRNKNGADFYQGPFQDGPASLIELVRHHAKNSEFYQTSTEDDSRKIAIDAFFEDGRYKTQSGREALVKDLTDGRNNTVWRTFLNLRNNPVIGQFVGASLVSKHPETHMNKLSGNINEHYRQSIEIAGQLYLGHLAGDTGFDRIANIANIAPDTKFSDTIDIAKILSGTDKPSYKDVNIAKRMLKMAKANKSTVFLDGEETKFGDVMEYTQKFIVNRGEQHYKQLLIAMGADESIFVTNTEILTTAPATSIRPQIRPTGLTGNIATIEKDNPLRPRARPQKPRNG